MGRIKTYDMEEVLNNGLALFWREGYENITIQDLVDNTGINRDSMYKEIGNKESFFIKVMHRYIENVFSYGPGTYLETHNGLDAIARFMTASLDMLDDRGCLILNAYAKYNDYPEPVQKMIDIYKTRIEIAFTDHLRMDLKIRQVQHLVVLLLAYHVGAISMYKVSGQKKDFKKAVKALLGGIENT